MGYSLCMPQRVIVGADSRFSITEIVNEQTVSHILVLTDQGVYQTGKVQQLLQMLAEHTLLVINDVPAEPTRLQIERIFANVVDFGAEMIIAIGGGSVLDTAKLLSAMCTNPAFAENMLHIEAIRSASLPVVMMPTTAGTGSEATKNAIVLLEESRVKQGIVHEKFIPAYVVLDPVMTLTVPANVTAATGIDALCHAIETMISKKTNPMCRTFSLSAIQLIFQNLRTCFQEPDNLTARGNMLLAAFYGGICINLSSTVAVHALSYPLGGTYRMAHGVSNAMLLVEVMRFNQPNCLGELAAIADALNIGHGMGAEQKSDLVMIEIEKLVKDVGIPTSLAQYNVQKQDITFLADAASQVTRLLDQNPREMTLEDISNIYRKLF